MPRPLLWILLLGSFNPSAHANEDGALLKSSAIGAAIDELLKRPAAQRTLWGIAVRDLETGSTIYARNPDKLFLPASNVKLFSTALALQRLGADYSFSTKLVAEGHLDEVGVLRGDLRLIGGGDPNLSARILPYRKKDEFGPDRLEPVRRLARQVRDAGIQRIAGDLIGDDSRYVWQPYPRGWSYADTLYDYGSPVSALVFNDNLIEVRVAPGPAHAAARLRVTPRLAFYDVVNRTTTTPGRYVNRQLAARWGERPGEVIVSGQIPLQSRGRTFRLAADDPARYAALALRKALEDTGIEVEGEVRVHHLLPDRLPSLRSLATPRDRSAHDALVEVPSASLRELIQVVNKDSENLHAEMLVREVALQESRLGSQEAAIASLQRFLAEVGIRTGEFVLRDASGLSRQNLVAPSATVRLLEYMWNSGDRDAYLASLPIAGRDGTLDWRFQRSPARGRIRAKTGSMSHVLALSGYAASPDGRTYAFSIVANNYGIASSSTRLLIDRVATALVSPDAG